MIQNCRIVIVEVEGGKTQQEGMGSVSEISEQCEMVIAEIMTSVGKEQVGSTNDKPRNGDKDCQVNTDR